MFLLATNLWTRHDGTLSTRRIRQASLSSISSLCCSDRLAHGLRHGLPTTTIGRWSTTPCLAQYSWLYSSLCCVCPTTPTRPSTRHSPSPSSAMLWCSALCAALSAMSWSMVRCTTGLMITLYAWLRLFALSLHCSSCILRRRVARLISCSRLFIGLVTILILKGKVQVQATLSAIKEMSGWTIYACLIRRTDACGAVA